MSPTTVLVTGANTGLGYEIVKGLLKSSREYRIFLGSRSVDKGEAAAAELVSTNEKSEISVVQIDISDDASIEKAYKSVSEKVDRIDVLINNAGGNFDMDILNGKIGTREGWNKGLDLNVTSTHLFTEAFMPLVFRSSDPRLLFITSGTSSLDEAARGMPYTAEKPPAGWPKPTPKWSFKSYRSSKAAMNMMMIEWKRELQNDPVKIFGISPGFLVTGLAGADPNVLKKMGAKDPSEGGNFVRDVVEGKKDEFRGQVIRFNDVQPW